MIEQALTTIPTLSPMVALWAALNFFLMFAKRTPFFPDWLIPWAAFILGGIVYPQLTASMGMPDSVLGAKVSIPMQMIFGLLIGGSAVCGHQGFRQWLKSRGLSYGDTEMIVKAQAVQKVADASAELAKSAETVEKEKP